MLYLGFPQSALPVLQEKAKGEGWNWTVVDERHIVVAGFVPQTGFEDWKSQRFRKDAEKGIPDSPEKAKPLWVPHDNLLLSLKEFYECTKYVFTRTGEASRLYRYGLGDKLRGGMSRFLGYFAMRRAEGFRIRRFRGLQALLPRPHQVAVADGFSPAFRKAVVLHQRTP